MSRPTDNLRKRVHYKIPLRNRMTGQRIKVSVFKAEPAHEQEIDPRPSMQKAAFKCWNTIFQPQKDAKGSHYDADTTKAYEGIKLLVDRGCDWVQIFSLIEQITVYPRSELSQMHRDMADFLAKESKKIRNFEKSVEAWEKEMREINSEIEQLHHVDVTSHAPDFEAYKAALRVAQINALPSARKANIQKESVVYLYHLLKLSTGSPHYKQLTDILNTRLRGVNRSEFDEKTLQRIVKRFKLENPEHFRKLEDGARRSRQLAPADWYVLPSLEIRGTKL